LGFPDGTGVARGEAGHVDVSPAASKDGGCVEGFAAEKVGEEDCDVGLGRLLTPCSMYCVFPSCSGLSLFLMYRSGSDIQLQLQW